MITITDLKTGTIFKENGQPWLVTKYSHSVVARGSANVKVNVKNLLTGQALLKSYSGNQTLEEADVRRKNATYLYSDSLHHFMDPDTYEQFTIDAEGVGDSGKFLQDGAVVQVLYFEARPVSITLPNTLDFKVTYTEPGYKGNTVSNVYKDATIDNGTIVKVPAFIKIGDGVKIDTRTGEYVSKS